MQAGRIAPRSSPAQGKRAFPAFCLKEATKGLVWMHCSDGSKSEAAFNRRQHAWAPANNRRAPTAYHELRMHTYLDGSTCSSRTTTQGIVAHHHHHRHPPAVTAHCVAVCMCTECRYNETAPSTADSGSDKVSLTLPDRCPLLPVIRAYSFTGTRESASHNGPKRDRLSIGMCKHYMALASTLQTVSPMLPPDVPCGSASLAPPFSYHEPACLPC